MLEQYAKVLRPFDGDRPYKRGEIVNMAGWRHARHLVEHRYLAPVAGPSAADDNGADPVGARRGPGRPRTEG